MLVGLIAIGLTASAGISAFAQSSGTWRNTGSMNIPRAGLTSTLLPTGEVLVTGGAYLDIKDPVKEFGEACRKELNHLYRAAS